MEHRPDSPWPFAFSAAIEYRLSGTALTVTVGMTNRHDAPAPAGIGVHPFFPIRPTILRCASMRQELGKTAWIHCHCATGRPAAIGVVSRRTAVGRSVSARQLLHRVGPHCRDSGWTGKPAGRGEQSVSSATGVYAILGGFFCVEPVSHVPDAINRPDLPNDQAMHVLQPDATLAGTVRFTPVG
jgi:aldose 1-epimerase